MSQYNAESLFHSVNDIFEQLDEGKVTESQANQILLNCCRAFIEANQQK